MSRQSAGDKVKVYYKHLVQSAGASIDQYLWPSSILEHPLTVLKGKAKAECWLLLS